MTSDVALNLYGNGMGDYTSPPSGVIAAYNAAFCNKSVVFTQYAEHGTSRENESYTMVHSAKAQ